LGRKAALVAFWIAGYVVGAFAWFVHTPILQFIGNLGLGSEASQALAAGFFGSSAMVLAVIFWSFLSSGER
jgi:hypothetical protein